MTKAQLRRREATRRLFIEYLKTPSLRELARRSGIPYRTLCYRFQHHIHVDYASLARRGIFNTIRYHLLSKNPRVRKEVSEWVVGSLDAIIQNEIHSSIVVLSERQINELTRTECSRYGDWKDYVAEVLPC